ncbi:MAG: DUF6352 family protein [Pseudomonadota bacterium]
MPASGPLTPPTNTNDFWKSAGLHLLEVGENGWLKVTPNFVRAYLTRPEVHPIDGSCKAEHRLHEALLEDPFREVTEDELKAIADADAIENYTVVLAFRQALMDAGTLEAAYLSLMRQPVANIPPVFIDQLVHVILRNALADVTDPIRLRAAEIFFRDQSVSTDDGRLMLADEEIIGMHAQTGSQTGIGQLLAETGTPLREVTLDVLDEDNKDIYWARSDRFDTVVDFRFEQPALDGFARVIETWLQHLLGVMVRVEPRPKLEDSDWRWHIGLDRVATEVLNKMYEGSETTLDEMESIIGLFRMRILDDSQVIDRVKGRPIYLALAQSPADTVKMKPQNLITNLPVIQAS